MWYNAEAKEKADIARVADQASEKAKARENATNSAVEEAATEIRAGAEDG